MAFGRPPLPGSTPGYAPPAGPAAPVNPAFARMAAMRRALKRRQAEGSPAEEAAESPQQEAAEGGR